MYFSWNHIYKTTNALTRFYKSSSSSISSFSSVETYLISFSFEHVTCTLPPKKIFSTALAFLREWFLWRLGGRSPPPPRPPPGYANERESNSVGGETRLCSCVSPQTLIVSLAHSSSSSTRAIFEHILMRVDERLGVLIRYTRGNIQ